jgi:hypothetical protein
LGTPLSELHHGFDKVKFPFLSIDPEHGYLLWYLVDAQRSLRFAPNTRGAFLSDHMSVSSFFRIQRSMFDVQFSQSLLGKNNLMLMTFNP